MPHGGRLRSPDHAGVARRRSRKDVPICRLANITVSQRRSPVDEDDLVLAGCRRDPGVELGIHQRQLVAVAGGRGRHRRPAVSATISEAGEVADMVDVRVKVHTRGGKPVDEHTRRHYKDLWLRCWLAVLLAVLLVVFLLSGGEPPEWGVVIVVVALACLVLTVR